MLSTIFLSNAFPGIASQTDALCNGCIQFLRETAAIYGCSYAEINIALFIVIMPLLILTFGVLSIVNMYKHTKGLRIFTWSVIGFTIFMGLLLIFPLFLNCIPTPS